MRIAVNFPYFIPYSGYFRLFSSTDIFVIFDCVPFPRRGYVHRNQLPDANQQPAWFTLPLNKVSRDTRIKDMTFVDDIEAVVNREARRFPVLQTPEALSNPLANLCLSPQQDLVEYLIATLKLTSEILELPFNVLRSSSLPIDPGLKGESRVLSIVEYLGGTQYVNAPGGRHLYDENNFKSRGITLKYLEPYSGNHWSVLYRLLTEDSAAIIQDIRQQSL